MKPSPTSRRNAIKLACGILFAPTLPGCDGTAPDASDAASAVADVASKAASAAAGAAEKACQMIVDYGPQILQILGAVLVIAKGVLEIKVRLKGGTEETLSIPLQERAVEELRNSRKLLLPSPGGMGNEIPVEIR